MLGQDEPLDAHELACWDNRTAGRNKVKMDKFWPGIIQDPDHSLYRAEIIIWKGKIIDFELLKLVPDTFTSIVPQYE